LKVWFDKELVGVDEGYEILHPQSVDYIATINQAPPGAPAG
jgi:hypothetical protein